MNSGSQTQKMLYNISIGDVIEKLKSLAEEISGLTMETSEILQVTILLLKRFIVISSKSIWSKDQGILKVKGKYHRTIDLLFDWFLLVCFANKNKNC